MDRDTTAPLPPFAVPDDAPPVLLARSEPRISRGMTEPRRVFGGPRSFGEVSSIAVAGDRLVVADRLTDPHITTIARETGRVGRYVARHGERRGQFYDPTCLYVVSSRPLIIWTYDFTLHLMSRLELDAPLANLEREEIAVRGRTLGCAFWVGGRIMATAYDGTARPIVEFDRNGNFIRGIEVPRRSDAGPLRTASLSVQPDGRFFAVSYRATPRIDVFSGSGLLERVLAPHASLLPTDGRTGRRDTLWAYTALSATDRFIYALLVPLHSYEGDQRDGARIHVYSWGGSLVRVFRLSKPIGVFVVANDDSLLYAAYRDSPASAQRIGEWDITANTGAVAAAAATVSDESTVGGTAHVGDHQEFPHRFGSQVRHNHPKP